MATHKSHYFGAFLTLSLLCISGAHAQGNSAAAGPKMQQQNPCLADVSKFEQSIGFIRQSAGQKVADDVKRRMLSEKEEKEILTKEGYCGLAKVLRERKLI